VTAAGSGAAAAARPTAGSGLGDGLRGGAALTAARGGVLATTGAREAVDRAGRGALPRRGTTARRGRGGPGAGRTTVGSAAAATGSAAKTSNLTGAGARSARRTRAASTIACSTTEDTRPARKRGGDGAGGGCRSVVRRGCGVGFEKYRPGVRFMLAAGYAYLPLPTPVAGGIGVSMPAG